VSAQLSHEDQQRLAGEFMVGGRRLRPHVMTPTGPYFIGSGPALPPHLRCPQCGQQKAREHPQADVWRLFCFGCGAHVPW
jgi:hypothetical protein